MQHSDSVILQDILSAAYAIRRYVDGLTESSFQQNDMTQAAVLYKLTVIGEAANRLSKRFQEDHPCLPWKNMIGMRNILIHTYDKVLLPYVWEAATESVSELIEALEPLVSRNDTK